MKIFSYLSGTGWTDVHPRFSCIHPEHTNCACNTESSEIRVWWNLITALQIKPLLCKLTSEFQWKWITLWLLTYEQSWQEYCHKEPSWSPAHTQTHPSCTNGMALNHWKMKMQQLNRSTLMPDHLDQCIIGLVNSQSSVSLCDKSWSLFSFELTSHSCY